MNTLKFITCGSVDDGKSTLIGRLLLDSKAILADQLASASHASTKGGTADAPDLAAFTDGLQAEREQGITIDVAWRYFSTPRGNSSSATPLVTSNTRATWSQLPVTQMPQL